MREILNAMRAAAAGGGARVETSRIGIVRGYDPSTYSVKVDLQPEGSSTGWIPLGSVWVGSSWGLFSPPSLGDQVTVVFQEGDQSAPVAQLRLFDDGNRPLPCPSGEFWLVHKSGSLLKFHNDGSVELTASAGITYTGTTHTFHGPVTMDKTLQVTQQIVGQGGMAVSGGTGAAMQVTGDMQASGTLTGQTDVVGGGKSLKNHTHGGVQPGSGNTGVPN